MTRFSMVLSIYRTSVSLRGAKRRGNLQSFCTLHFALKKRSIRADSHRDLHAPNWIFSRNTASKCHGRRQPYRGILSCLAEKSLILECYTVLRLRFFFRWNPRGRRNTGCISRTMDFLWRKRLPQNRINPYVSPPKLLFFLLLCWWSAG